MFQCDIMKSLEKIDKSRILVSSATQKVEKSNLGQFFTPFSTATFMASLFSNLSEDNLSLLDPGAGIGSLTSSFIEQYFEKNPNGKLNIDAIELDTKFISTLQDNLNLYEKDNLNLNVFNADFIEDCCLGRLRNLENYYSNIIINPPYKKINSLSKYKPLLKSLDLDTVNLYSAFMLLSISKLKENGELVGIIPRSFCNGVYYKSFRKFLLENTMIRQIHLINSRRSAFVEDDVLQENVILHLVKKSKQTSLTNKIKISHTNLADFSEISVKNYSYQDIIKENDQDLVIHIPNLDYKVSDVDFKKFTLSDLNLMVSTGPVVDFRLKNLLSNTPSDSKVPLLYPSHFSKFQIQWPLPNFKKYNYIESNSSSTKLLYPKGNYVLVKRFSSKEEKRRISACLLLAEDFDFPLFGFENHLNVFHMNKSGLSIEICYGLMSYLNSTFVDNFFRQFSGHTQVNASDLRKIPYPSLEFLSEMGVWAEKNHEIINTELIDIYLNTISNAC
ncbi:Eco57I restriction-modification methylase domain-containing protein [Leptospira meyeri]|uniref:Eco57I restriction-modification methylase domain-containing protein n=1 Tax=Leptospira meyeri TaxID=29508 RepID=UPI003B8A8E24